MNATVWTWGNNEGGQLGDGTLPPEVRTLGQTYEHEFRATARKVPGLAAVASLTAYAEMDTRPGCVFALTSEGTVWGWGFNSGGRLGDGSGLTTRARPIRVGGLTSVVAIRVRLTSAFALKEDGSVWVWGTLRLAHEWPTVSRPPDLPVPSPIDELRDVVALAPSTGWFNDLATL